MYHILDTLAKENFEQVFLGFRNFFLLYCEGMLLSFYHSLIQRGILSPDFSKRCAYACFALIPLYFVLWGQGIVNSIGAPYPTKDVLCDFKAFYTAGQLAAEGTPALAYDYGAHKQKQRLLEGEGSTAPYIQFPYPPYFLAFSELLATLDYLPALVLWQLGSLALAMLAMYRIFPLRETVLIALAAPVYIANFAHGQTAFLTAALMGFFLVNLEKRPLLAGVFAGLLAYKFQFGLLIPVALIMGGYGKTFLSAAATVGMMTLGVTALYGPDIWPSFFHNVVNQMRYFEGSDQQLEMIHSLFSFVHHTMGAPKGLGYAVQGVIQVGVLGCILWLWRKNNTVPYALKAAALASGALLMTPYLMDYDLFVLLPALVFIGRYQKDFGFVPYGKTIPILLWVMCAFARQLYGITTIPFGFLTLLATFGFVMVLAKQALDNRMQAHP